MNEQARASLLKKIDEFQAHYSSLDADWVEQYVGHILEPLLVADGYSIIGYDPEFGHAANLDFIAYRDGDKHYDKTTIGIQHKRTDSPLSADDVRHLLADATRIHCNRALFFSLSSFAPEALIVASHSEPIAVELMDFGRIREWAKGKQDSDQSLDSTPVTSLRRETMRKYIALLARSPAELASVEWRELEHMMEEICRELGFNPVELTPPSKDGGRDLVLTARVGYKKAKYLMELKHWKEPNRVGSNVLREFVNVVIQDNADKGIVLSSSGFTKNAVSQLTQLERNKLRVGDRHKIIGLCRTYVQKQGGLWSPEVKLVDVLFESTLY